MKLDDIDIANPDAYLAGVPHAQFARLRREAPTSRRDSPDDHLSFGSGGHFCLGASLSAWRHGWLFEQILRDPGARVQPDVIDRTRSLGQVDGGRFTPARMSRSG